MSPAIFDFNGRVVRCVTEGEPEPLFVGRDVTEILGYSNSAKAISDHCKGITKRYILSGGGSQEMTVIPERDVYRLIMRSKLSAAEKFEEWVVSEVLPAIRKTGSYSVTAAPDFALPASFAEALQLAADQAKQLEIANGQLEAAAPKIEFHDAVTASDKVVVMAVAAQTAKLPFGSNTLYKKLREMGVLISGGTRHNLPKQKYIEQGLFTVNEFKFEHSTGEPGVSFTTHVTQKGIAWLVSKFGKGDA